MLKVVEPYIWSRKWTAIVMVLTPTVAGGDHSYIRTFTLRYRALWVLGLTRDNFGLTPRTSHHSSFLRLCCFSPTFHDLFSPVQKYTNSFIQFKWHLSSSSWRVTLSSDRETGLETCPFFWRQSLCDSCLGFLRGDHRRRPRSLPMSERRSVAPRGPSLNLSESPCPLTKVRLTLTQLTPVGKCHSGYGA